MSYIVDPKFDIKEIAEALKNRKIESLREEYSSTSTSKLTKNQIEILIINELNKINFSLHATQLAIKMTQMENYLRRERPKWNPKIAEVERCHWANEKWIKSTEDEMHCMINLGQEHTSYWCTPLYLCDVCARYKNVKPHH